MKVIKSLSLALLVLLLLFSCNTGSGSSSGGSTENTGTENDGDNDNDDNTGITVDRSLQVVDDSGALVGYYLDSYSTTVTIMTSLGYKISLKWNGDLRPNSDVYFSSVDGSGDAFIRRREDIIGDFFDGKATFYANNKIYIPLKPDGEVHAQITDFGDFTYNSLWTNPADDDVYEMQNSTNSINPFRGVQLQETTREAIGLPATITGPLDVTVVTD